MFYVHFASFYDIYWTNLLASATVPLPVYYVCLLQKMSKNESGRKILENHRNSNIPEDPGSQKESRRGAIGGPYQAQARLALARAWGWYGGLVRPLATPLRL